ncbi:MAG: FtsX-like permease family protein, partial [bacterium]
ERTREIGIRRALGARQKDIFAQFLIEACMISLIGGIIGIIIGIIGTNILALTFNIPLLINLWFIILGFMVSILVGIFFGVYPAKSASSLFPIEALRYE